MSARGAACPRIVALLSIVTAVTGCGGTSGPDASGPDGSEKVIELLAELEVIDTTVEKDAGDGFVTASTGDAVGTDEVVHTDATGFAQLDYVDGSLARLGPETTLTVVALAQDTGPVNTRVDLDAGRLWNRVEGVTESEGRYEVGTSVGVAAVRGTAFDVACDPDGCTFVVLEGVLEVTLLDGSVIRLEAPQRLRVGIDGDAGDPEDVPIQELLDDAWVADNLARDERAGFAPVGGSGDGGGEAIELPDAPSPPTDATGRRVADSDVVATTAEGELVVVAWDGGAEAPVGVSGFAPRWSSDATLIVYEDEGELFVTSPDGSVTAQITHTPDVFEQVPVWSPDDREIAYLAGDGRIQILTLADGAVRDVYTGSTFPGSFDWGGPAPGTLVYSVGGELFWADPDGTVTATFAHGGVNSQHLRIAADGAVLYHLNSADAATQETRVTELGGAGDAPFVDRFTFGDFTQDWVVAQVSAGALEMIFRQNPEVTAPLASQPLVRPDAWWLG